MIWILIELAAENPTAAIISSMGAVLSGVAAILASRSASSDIADLRERVAALEAKS